MNSNCRNRAYTLTEVIAALAIILIISALVVPVATRARDASQAAACLGKLRSYGNAIMCYVADNGGSLPSWNGTDGSSAPQFGKWTAPYLGYQPGAPSELRCPLFRDKTKGGFFYSGNAALCIYYPRLKSIPAPSSRIVLAAENCGRDSFYVPGHLNRTIWGNADGSADPSNEGTARPPQCHTNNGKVNQAQRGLNMFFLDGHAALVAPTENDWSKTPTYGNATNGGIFFHSSQFSKMKTGALNVQ